MKAIKVDMDGVEEIEMPDDFVLSETVGWDWDCVRLDNGHDAWVRDDALFQPTLSVATFGDRPNVPLPAFIMGADGERTVGATMTVDEASALVSSRKRVF